MTTLAADKQRSHVVGDRNDQPVIAADIIYQDAAVGDNGSGYARPLVAGDPFRGFATERCDNSAGAAGDKRVNLRQRGRVILPVSAAAITDVDKPVYASDDDTFTFTASTNSYIGRVVRWVSTGYVEVEYDVSRGGFGALAALTDSSGGTPSTTTVAAIGGSFSQSEIANNFATITARLNALSKMLVD